MGIWVGWEWVGGRGRARAGVGRWGRGGAGSVLTRFLTMARRDR